VLCRVIIDREIPGSQRVRSSRGAGQAELVEELPVEGCLQWRGRDPQSGWKSRTAVEAVELRVAIAASV
jgi:hypothetical protein